MIENQVIYCVYCDAENTVDAERCVSCGRILDWSDKDEESK
jgi:ribosomal protein L40E